MPGTFKAYPNGVSMGIGNPAPTGGLRKEITGWSRDAVRRHKRWLYGIEAGELTGVGHAVTLTMRHTPPSEVDWANVRTLLMQSLRDAGMIRWHWVVEWQRRGTPHLHMAVYGPPGTDPGEVAVAAWLRVAGPYGAIPAGQYVTPISGPVGWLKYLSKHASRGVAHYQRQGKPSGWTKTGRLWGYGGSWPSVEPVHGQIDQQTFWRFRRLVRRYVIADARARGDWRGVAYLRTMLRCPDRNLSAVRGVSEWVPGRVALDLLAVAGWAGELAPEPAVQNVANNVAPDAVRGALYAGS